MFVFVEDGSELTIALAAAEAPSVAVELENQAGSPTEPPAAPPPGHADPSSAEPAGVSCRLPPTAPSPLPQQRGGGSSGTRAGAAAKASTVRVPSERLDRLVRLVGELVMNQSRLTQVAARASVPNLAAPVEELERLVAELRDNVLGIRMMPIGTTFSRFKRLVHDLSQELGKEIDLVTEGAETELDKTVLDQLGDPLAHLIRNSLDHGIELPAERLRRGKPRCGTIALSATHVGSNVVITIRDDGRGIDPRGARQAVGNGSLRPTTLTERELYDLIFRPGFSTAQQVTSVSGRGVGMDVVKRQFDALRGQVRIASEIGRGTTLTLTLPLTLAIIEGLLVEIGHDQFIVPMSDVAENVELPRAERSRHNGRNAIPVRGELVVPPFARHVCGGRRRARPREDRHRPSGRGPRRLGGRSRIGQPPNGHSIARPFLSGPRAVLRLDHHGRWSRGPHSRCCRPAPPRGENYPDGFSSHLL